MKFWQKSFLAILGVVIVSINGCLYLTSRYSFSLNVQQETNRALGEYHVIAAGIDETLIGIRSQQSAVPTASVLSSAMRALADYYSKQDVYIALQQSHSVIFSNLPAAARSGLRSQPGSSAHDVLTIRRQGGTHYLYIVGSVHGLSGQYTFTYVTNLAALYNNYARLVHYLILVSVVTESLLALALLAILQRLTRPIRLMQQATRKIAGGVYDERVRIVGRDEFHDLAENFNRMAMAVQDRIAALDTAVHDKQRLMDNLSHELKTPLTAIKGHARYLQRAHSSEQHRIKAVGYILSATDRMQELIHKILDMALIRNSKLAFEEVHPQELLREVEALTASKLHAQGITLDLQCALDEPLIGDAILLQSLLINLIDNAAKASPDHTVITLAAYRAGFPTLEVRDEGHGMAEEQLSRIWEPFYRVDSSRSRSAGGVGLGLSLCREIARLHQANLEIHTQLGHGTTVRLVFTTPLQLHENYVTSEP